MVWSRLRTLTLLGNWCCRSSSRTSGGVLSFWNFTSEWTIVLVLLLTTLSNTSQECPAGCDCKWKSGKESVTCSRARLRSIPEGLDPNTQVLELPGNMIERLPSKVFFKLNLLNLQKIFLSECQLVSLETDTFAKLSNLIELELSGNRLELIPSNTFDFIPELRELKLNSNPVARLSNDAFVALPRLVRLELTGCKLGTIETWAFRGLPALQWLRLDNNRLLTIQAETFFPLRSLHGLEIAGNPWNCSCTLQPWREWMIKNNVPFGIPPLCFYPKRLEGKSWDRLQLEDFACLPTLTSSTDQERISRVVEGENGTLLCRLQTTPDTQVRWLNGNKGSGVVTNGSVGTMTSSSAFVLTEYFVKSGSSTFPLENESSSSSQPAMFDEYGSGRTKASRGGDRSLGVKISKLTVIRATPREAGLYICTAETKAGFVSANFTLHVLTTKTENLTGRLLFTGALVAALLLVVVCLLLVCVIVGTRRFRYGSSASRSTTTEEKIELNHVGQHRNHDGHEGQNGGNNIPLMRDHDRLLHEEQHDDCKNIIITPALTNHYSSKTSNAVDRNTHAQHQRQQLPSLALSVPLNNNNAPGQEITKKKSHSGGLSGDRVPRDCDYKAVPVVDHEDELDDEEEDEDYNNNSSDGGESGDDSSTPVGEIVNNNHKRLKNTNPGAGVSCSFPAMSSPPKPPTNNPSNMLNSNTPNINKRHSSPANNTGNNNNNNKSYELSPSNKLLDRTNRTTTGIGIRSSGMELLNSSFTSSASPSYSQSHQQQQQQQPLPNNTTSNSKYPDLIDEKMSFSNFDCTSLPRPNKNRDPRIGSYFHRRNNSTDSQYPLISSSHGNSLERMSGSTELPFVSSSNPDSLSAIPSLYAKSRTSSSTNYSHHHHHHHPHHHHFQSHSNSAHLNSNAGSSLHSSGGGMNWSQRFSMPTSPVHEKSFANSIPPSTYDYHAAQLAAFLEEYRSLQMELMRMSSNLTNATAHDEDYGNSNNSVVAGSTSLNTNTNSSSSALLGTNCTSSSRPFAPSTSSQLHYAAPHYNNSVQLFHEQNNPISSNHSEGMMGNSGNNRSPYHHTHHHHHPSPHHQLPPTNNYGLARPPSLNTAPSHRTFLPTAGASSSSSDFHQHHNHHQSTQHLKSILKNPASMGGGGSTANANTANNSPGSNFTNTKNHNNNYMA